jgi:hypothetical protein
MCYGLIGPFLFPSDFPSSLSSTRLSSLVLDRQLTQSPLLSSLPVCAAPWALLGALCNVSRLRMVHPQRISYRSIGFMSLLYDNRFLRLFLLGYGRAARDVELRLNLGF